MTRPAVLRQSLSALAVCGLALGSVAPADAQYFGYFGKNKVQHREYNWQIYHSPHFDVYYYTEDEELLQRMVSFAESAYDELSRTFDYQIQDPTPLIAYETHSAFQQTNVILAGVPEGAQAFATSSKFRIVMPMDQPAPEMQALIRHELTHIFQYHILFRGRFGLRGQPPLWFIEGMASYFGKDETPGDKKYMIDAVVNDNIPSVAFLGGGFFAYRFGNSMFSYIEERWGRDAILDFIYEFRNTFGSRIERAIERSFRMDVEDFDAEFRRWARKKYLPELLETGEPGDFGRPFRLNRGKIGHEMAPAASPSGDLVAALTTDRGEVDVSLFDAKTRRRIRNLTRGLDTDIRGIVVRTNRERGGDLAFSPDGNTIAAFGRREGGRSLLLFDVINGGMKKIIDMPGVEQQRSPSFSPDGRYVAFAGNIRGTNDIFLVDLETLEVSNVTKDEIFDAAPTFSPDGRWLTYTSVVGDHAQIFRLDPSDPESRYQLTTHPSNNKEAAYSRDGSRIYFASDRSGADNIYSLDLDSGKVQKYTNAITGCDRPTVLPLPEGGERLVYASYWKGRFGLYTTDVEEPLGEPETAEVPEEPAVLGELPRFEPDIEVSIDERNNEEYGGFNFFLEDAVSVLGVDTNQVFVGRVLMLFSDYLGDRRIIANLAAVDTFSDFDLLYLNQQKRRQWGLRLFDTRIFVFANQRVLDPFNRNLERDQVYSITGLEYLNIFPMSESNRVEVGAGYYYRDSEVSLFRRTADGDLVPLFPVGSDDYPQVKAAFVSDNTVYNQWGPATGHRVRLDASYAPDLDDSGTLINTYQLDARQYLPLTRRSSFAFRLFGYDSKGNTPNSIFIGGLDTIRGFDTRSLGGTRAFFANAELRFPLIDRLAFPGFGFQGIRGVIFFDVGSAWFPDQGFDFLDDDDRLKDAFAVYGWGISMRLFGLPVQWDFSMRTDLKDDLDDGFETNFWIGTRF